MFSTSSEAAAAARALHATGVAGDRISVVARNHDEEGALAEQFGATPGAEVEDSRPAARLGELGAHVLAAIAIVMPGIGPIVAAGPLAAGLGEAAGHVAGGVSAALRGAGVEPERAEAIEQEVSGGAILLGVHARPGDVTAMRRALESAGGRVVAIANWQA
jgi:hypothetical protein